jgi:hypothetical protein
VNMMTQKQIGLKSHDYHIIMKRLLPIMFRGYFDDAVWMVLAERSYFYRQLFLCFGAIHDTPTLDDDIDEVYQ